MFGVNSVIGIRVQATEAIMPLTGGDVGADGERFHVFEIDDRARQRRIRGIKDGSTDRA